MIYINNHAFELVEGKNKLLKLQRIHSGEMGPYRVKDPDFPSDMELSPVIFEAYREFVLDDLLWVTKKVYNEGYIVAFDTMVELDKLAKAYEFEQVVAWFKRYWLEMENVSFCNQFVLEERSRPDTEEKNRVKIKVLKDEIVLSDYSSAMIDARISYLESEVTNLSSPLKEMEARLQTMEDKDHEGWFIEVCSKLMGYDKLAGKIRSNKITIAHLKGEYSNKRVVVTDDMIALAKQVPFNKLLKVYVIGNRAKALCPFHNEKTPSFVIYGDTNRGHCHGCGRNVDTIQYLVEIKKIKFNEAVLMLLNY